MKEDNSTLPKDEKSSTSSKKGVFDAATQALVTGTATTVLTKLSESITTFAKGMKKK